LLFVVAVAVSPEVRSLQATGYLQTFVLQAAIGAAVGIAALAQFLATRRRGTRRWMTHWLLLVGGQVAAYFAAMELGQKSYGEQAIATWAIANICFLSSSFVLMVAARAVGGETRVSNWFYGAVASVAVLGAVVATWSVTSSSASGADFIGRSGGLIRVVNIASALISARILRQSAVWAEEPGVRVLGWALIAVALRALVAIVLALVPATLLPSWTGTGLVVLQVVVQIWFGIGTTTAILSLDRLERMVADRRLDDLERAILQAQRHESLGQMASGVAHDFRNILTVVRSSAEMALLDLPADATAANDLREIIRASERGAKLTTQLLSYARGAPDRVTEFELTSHIDLMAPMLSRLLPQSVQFQSKLAVKATVAIDPLQLDQMLLNLVVNARDAITGPGTITVETAATMAMPDTADGMPNADGPFVRLRVSDTGSGIPPEVLPRIFERFFSTKPATVGTGLGLPTCYTIVRRYGGNIVVSSQVGRGTDVDVYLPAEFAMTERRSDEVLASVG
jgi:signal transduction histidine kinase